MVTSVRILTAAAVALASATGLADIRIDSTPGAIVDSGGWIEQREPFARVAIMNDGRSRNVFIKTQVEWSAGSYMDTAGQWVRRQARHFYSPDTSGQCTARPLSHTLWDVRDEYSEDAIETRLLSSASRCSVEASDGNGNSFVREFSGCNFWQHAANRLIASSVDRIDPRVTQWERVEQPSDLSVYEREVGFARRDDTVISHPGRAVGVITNTPDAIEPRYRLATSELITVPNAPAVRNARLDHLFQHDNKCQRPSSSFSGIYEGVEYYRPESGEVVYDRIQSFRAAEGETITLSSDSWEPIEVSMLAVGGEELPFDDLNQLVARDMRVVVSVYTDSTRRHHLDTTVLHVPEFTIFGH